MVEHATVGGAHECQSSCPRVGSVDVDAACVAVVADDEAGEEEADDDGAEICEPDAVENGAEHVDVEVCEGGGENTFQTFTKKHFNFFKMAYKIHLKLFVYYIKLQSVNMERNTIPQLKDICKQYKLKVSGNKTQLVERINKHLKETTAAKKIQRAFRLRLVQNYNYFKGIHLKPKCINETDFYSLDDISEVSYEQFFAFKDVSGHVYGWDIASLWNLLVRTKPGEKLLNPYNCQPFPTDMWSSLNSIFRISKALKINIKFNVDVDESYMNSFESKLLSTFQHINSLGNYSDHNWVLELDIGKLQRFLQELRDIWVHRAGLDDNTRNLICFHFPFVNYNSNLVDFDSLREISLATIMNMVYKGQNAEYQQLGCMYVLTALTIVSQSAANSLPWLYASVV